MDLTFLRIAIFTALMSLSAMASGMAKEDDWDQLRNDQATIHDADGQWKVLEQEGNVNSADDLPESDAAEQQNSAESNSVKPS